MSRPEQVALFADLPEAPPASRVNDRPEAAALAEVLKALKHHPLVAWVERQNSGVARKGIIPHGARQDRDGSLVVPVFDPDGRIQSVQFIGIDGVKRNLKYAAMKSGRMFIGDLENGEPIILTEGWATACSIREATGNVVVNAFSGSNLAIVAADLRRKLPDSPLRIAGDLDDHGKGLEYARVAVAARTGLAGGCLLGLGALAHEH